MNLGYDIAGALPEFQSQARSRFTETFTFFTAAEGIDPVTLRPTYVETILAANIAGRIKFSNTQGNDVESGGQFPVVGRREVHVAVGSVSASPGVFVRVTASTADAGLVGRVLRVVDRSAGGQVSAWRYPVEEVS
jgi:hypothetical protein